MSDKKEKLVAIEVDHRKTLDPRDAAEHTSVTLKDLEKALRKAEREFGKDAVVLVKERGGGYQRLHSTGWFSDTVEFVEA